MEDDGASCTLANGQKAIYREDLKQYTWSTDTGLYWAHGTTYCNTNAPGMHAPSINEIIDLYKNNKDAFSNNYPYYYSSTVANGGYYYFYTPSGSAGIHTANPSEYYAIMICFGDS